MRFLELSVNGQNSQKTVIIGGGLVGLHLARRLAEKGVEVELHEAKRNISEGADKASGILSISGLQKVGLDYESAIVNVLYGAYLYSGDERLKIASKKPMAYVLDRKILSVNSERAARRAGAKIFLSSQMTRDKLQKLESDGNIIVGADGAVSTVGKVFGFPSITDYVLTYKAEFKVPKITETNMVGLYFSRDFAHGLFGWHVPYSNDTVEVGLGIHQKKKLNSKRAFDKFLSSDSLEMNLGNKKPISEHASIIPISSRRTTAKGNVALVGDAAGQVKATTGGGIIYGCLCADVLSQVIANGRPLKEYDKWWRKAYGRELRLHNLAHSYYSSGNLKNTFKLMKAIGMEEFLGKYGDMDSPSLILKRFLFRRLAK